MRDTTKLIALGRASTSSTMAQIRVYSPAGESLFAFSVDARLYYMMYEKY